MMAQLETQPYLKKPKPDLVERPPLPPDFGNLKFSVTLKTTFYLEQQCEPLYAKIEKESYEYVQISLQTFHQRQKPVPKIIKNHVKKKNFNIQRLLMLSEYEQKKEIKMKRREHIILGVRECDSEDEANEEIMVEHHYVLNRA